MAPIRLSRALPARLSCAEVYFYLTSAGGVGEVHMKYTVLIEESEEGFAVSVPGLPGCHSQGATEAEALANIREAIREYLDVIEELATSAGAKKAAVEV